MIYTPTWMAVTVFLFFISLVLGLSYFLGSKAKDSAGYFAAHGQIPWFVNGIAFAGDYLSAASFLGTCGLISFFGYDGFLYSIGYLAGWVVALFVVAEPLKRMGRFTFADALDSRFNSSGVKLAAAISTLVVSLFYLIPQMVGAGVLIKPLLGFSYAQGVIIVGVVVIFIVVTAGMVSTTWVQFIKGSMLVLFCLALTFMIFHRGLNVSTATLPESQTVTVVTKEGKKHTLVDGLPQGAQPGQADLAPMGRVVALPGGVTETGALAPWDFLKTLDGSKIELWRADAKKDTVVTPDGTAVTTTYRPKVLSGSDLLLPGASPTFAGLRKTDLIAKLDFLSLMLALFCGTASLPHVLIRYYTVKDQISARKSTVVGIAAIGFFYVLTLFLGLGAMTSSSLDMTNSNMSMPLLARSFGELPFAVISAIAFTTVLGTVCGLIIAACGAVVHDLVINLFKVPLDDKAKVSVGKLACVGVGVIAIVCGILFEKFNVSFLVGWAFNIAASANLPALILLLFWPKTTAQGITASIFFGMITSLTWVLLSKEAYQYLYNLPATQALVPFSQPGLVTIPLSFLVLIVVSLVTQKKQRHEGVSPAH